MYWFEKTSGASSPVKKIFLVSCSFSILFVATSLFLYDADAPSLFFFTTARHTSYSFGSTIATLLRYLFGGAAYAVVAASAVAVWWSHNCVQKKYRLEQYGALGMLPLLVALFLHTYAIDGVGISCAGGAVGKILHQMLMLWCGPTCALFLLHVFLIVAVFMLTSAQTLALAHMIVAAVCLVVEHRIVQRTALFAYRIILICCVRPLKFLFTLVRDMITGTLFKETDLLAPEDSNQYAQELRELHLQLKQDALSGVSDTSLEQENLPHVSEQVIQPALQQIGTVLTPSQDQKIGNKHYQLPKLDIFIGLKKEQNDEGIKQQMQERAQLLEKKLERFGVTGTVTAIKRGPVVTLFEYMPGIDTKLSKIINLEDDLAMALEALSIRIIAPIPGKALVGFEVSNTTRTDVAFAALVNSTAYTKFAGSLPLILGHDTVGKEVIVDLAKMPHLLIAGSTGSGKSVALNVMLVSLLCKLAPDQLQLILIDPKRLEFMSYADIPHLVFPIITDPKKVVHVLKWVVHQMEQRYEQMAQMGVRHLVDYNEKCEIDDQYEKLPFIVVVIDELSDLMLTVGRDIEDLITRITQMARAAGIHIMVATQRPSVDVITGLIKVNFPSRISFRVTSRIDSRTILDCNGADKLLGRGDMLFLDAVNAQLQRVHGAFITTAEIERVVHHIRLQGAPNYLDFGDLYGDASGSGDQEDALYQEVLNFLNETDDISISLLQRKFRIGYNRSARIIDMLESHGRIMPLDGSKTRKVIRQ